MSESKHFHGVVTRFSAGPRSSFDLLQDLAASLKTIRASGAATVHGCALGVPPADLQTLTASLRVRGIDVVFDRDMSPSGVALLIFTPSALSPTAATRVAQSVSRMPAGRKVIDCEGYTYLMLA